MARSNSLQPNTRLLKKALIFSAFFCLWLLQSPMALASGACPPQHIDETARVNYVYDGDSLQLEDGRKIRLLGIDTPETFSKRGAISKDIKRYGESAKLALKTLLRQSKQRIGLAFGAQRFDHYQRTLAHVFLADGTNLQAELIAQGHAIAFTTPPNDGMSDCYQRLEAQAIKHKLGIWQLPQYQLKLTHQLNNRSKGFHRLRAQVTRVWKTQHRVTFLLDNKVEVKIRRYDLVNFNAHMLNNLVHKNIEIRGWLRSKKPSQTSQNKIQFSMSLRHPDAIKMLHLVK